MAFAAPRSARQGAGGGRVGAGAGAARKKQIDERAKRRLAGADADRAVREKFPSGR